MKDKATRSLLLEAYIDFYSDPWSTSISLAHLKQIVAMHGFQQLYARPKKHYVECLSSVDLMMPWRSTLEKGVSSSSSPAFLTDDEIASDLAELGWHECQIRSIVSFDPRSAVQADCGCDFESPAANDGAFPSASLPRRSKQEQRIRTPPAANDGAFPSAALPRRSKQEQRIRTPPADFVVSGKRPRSKRRRISINALAGVASAFYPVVVVVASPEATPYEEAASHPTCLPIHVTSSPDSPCLSSPS